MRKIIAISFLSVFALLQYGKALSYLYCKLQVEITTKSTLSCDCEKIISDHNEPASVPAPHSHAVKDKLNQPFISETESIAFLVQKINTSYFINHSITLRSGFENPPYHPPAQIS
jgi:hypothetical protein